LRRVFEIGEQREPQAGVAVGEEADFEAFGQFVDAVDAVVGELRPRWESEAV